VKRTLGLGLIVASFAVACFPTTPVEEGGANANDRTFGGDQGEALLTGVMEVSANGHFAVMQRNTITVLLDIQSSSYKELPEQFSRVALSKNQDVGYALLQSGALVAYDLPTASELWRSDKTFSSVSLLKLMDDDSTLLVGDGQTAFLIDPSTGEARTSEGQSTEVSYSAFLPKSNKAVLVGKTSWSNHKPSTPVSIVDLKNGDTKTITIPNCEAPVAVLPDETRLLISPTFCEEDKASNPDDQWTNPDPVSVVDVSTSGLSFLKNLPGFGPVALTPDGSRAVAYLDTKRVDASMFDDKSKVPAAGGAQYHLMVIDPHSLDFTVTKVGDGLPRFAMTRDGKGLLVDSSVKVITRTHASASATIDIGPKGISGQVDANVSIFGEQTPFGYFDLDSRAFIGFQGPQAGLDRFVQLGDMKTVVTLQKRADGLGGIPFSIDLNKKTTSALTGDYGTGVRDIGLLADGATILLRFRQPAAQIGTQLFARETYCLSLDGLTCASGRVEYQASVSFASVETNDCPVMGHDCW
jgi:hypothetical protein